jgi:hypothetical protein
MLCEKGKKSFGDFWKYFEEETTFRLVAIIEAGNDIIDSEMFKKRFPSEAKAIKEELKKMDRIKHYVSELEKFSKSAYKYFWDTLKEMKPRPIKNSSALKETVGGSKDRLKDFLITNTKMGGEYYNDIQSLTDKIIELEPILNKTRLLLRRLLNEMKKR